MKTTKILLLSAVAAGAILMAGCGNDENSLGVGGKAIDKKTLAALNLTGAPAWVINGGQGDMSAVGIADIINGDLGYARTEALALARDELARQVGVQVEGMISRAANQSKSSMGDVSAESLSEQITKQSVSQTLSGTKQTDTWISGGDAPKIFVLLKLSPELQKALQKNVSKQIQQSKLPSDVKKQAIQSVMSGFDLPEATNE